MTCKLSSFYRTSLDPSSSSKRRSVMRQCGARCRPVCCWNWYFSSLLMDANRNRRGAFLSHRRMHCHRSAAIQQRCADCRHLSPLSVRNSVYISAGGSSSEGFRGGKFAVREQISWEHRKICHLIAAMQVKVTHKPPMTEDWQTWQLR